MNSAQEKRIEKVRDGIDEKIAKCVTRAHMLQPRPDDVIFLAELLKWYRGELYKQIDRIEDSVADLAFNESLEARRHGD